MLAFLALALVDVALLTSGTQRPDLRLVPEEALKLAGISGLVVQVVALAWQMVPEDGLGARGVVRAIVTMT